MFGPGNPEVSRVAERAARFDKLKKTPVSLEKFAQIHESNPELKATLDKALAIGLARFGPDEVIPAVEAWPDAVKDGDYVDITASIHSRIQRDGIAGLKEFGDVTMKASDFARAAEPVPKEIGEQLEKLLLGE